MRTDREVSHANVRCRRDGLGLMGSAALDALLNVGVDALVTIRLAPAQCNRTVYALRTVEDRAELRLD
jgi:hypothetical protein